MCGEVFFGDKRKRRKGRKKRRRRRRKGKYVCVCLFGLGDREEGWME